MDTVEYGDMKERINLVFRQLRKEGIVAKQNFTCCNTCGMYEMGENHPGKDYVFYHAQATSDLQDEGFVYLNFGTVHAAQRLADLAAKAGLKVTWNGSEDRKVRLDLPGKSLILATEPLDAKLELFFMVQAQNRGLPVVSPSWPH